MSDSDSTILEEPIEGLRATPSSSLPFGRDLVVRSFLLERPAGNLLIYNSPGLAAAAEEIAALGGATHLFINHGHEAMYGPPGVDVPVFVDELDRDEIAASMPVASTFTERERIGDDFEVIPTPGHTPGATCYLWEAGGHRLLFTGDGISSEDGRWHAVVLGTSDRAAYIESLRLLGELEFDVLVPWAATAGEPAVDAVTPAEARERMGEIAARLEAGENE